MVVWSEKNQLIKWIRLGKSKQVIHNFLQQLFKGKKLLQIVYCLLKGNVWEWGQPVLLA